MKGNKKFAGHRIESKKDIAVIEGNVTHVCTECGLKSETLKTFMSANCN